MMLRRILCVVLPVACGLLRAQAPDPVVVPHNKFRSTSPWTEYRRSVQVAMTGLDAWARAGNDPKTLRLFLAGHMLKREPLLISLAEEYVSFELSAVDDEDRKAWADVFFEARQSPRGRVPISVGPEGKRQPFISALYTQLSVYPGYWPWVVLLVVALLIALLWLGRSTNLLRDGFGIQPDPPARLPYSLGQVQMASWFYLVIVSFLFIWLITGEYNTPTPSVLALIGISAGTGLAASFVDREKLSDLATRRATLTTERQALETRIAELSAGTPAAGSALDAELQAKKARLAEVQASIAAFPETPKPVISKGFFRDLLSDGSGASFHRFQIVVWTIILCLIFTREVLRKLAMPELDASLLGLMGISSGTYVGFKFPEKPKS